MLKIGIIGDFESLAGLTGIFTGTSSYTFTGIYHPEPEQSGSCPEEIDIPVFSSYQAFLSNCEAVIVEQSSCVKSGHIIEALRNTKHVLLEKPLDWPDDELEYLFKLADEANTFLKLREAFLFHPVIQAAKPIVQSPAFIDYQIGISADTLSEKLSGLISSSIFQCLDAILHLNPARITRSNTVFSPDLFGFPGVIHGRLEFDNGCISNITCNGYAEQQKSICYVYQENRHAILNFLSNRLVIKDKIPGEDKLKSTVVPLKPADPVMEEIMDFVQLILNKSYHLIPYHNYFQSFMLGRKMLQNLPIHTVSV